MGFKTEHEAAADYPHHLRTDGIGVFDMLAEKGQPVIGLQSSGKAYDSESYFNLRAEMWWTARETFFEQYKYGNKLSIT